MKIRKGFVSNSSSSSFCIYGCEIPDKVTPEEALEIIKMSEGLHDRLDRIIATLKERDNDWARIKIELYGLLKRLDDPDVFAETKERGCSHDIMRIPDCGKVEAKFCPICGAPTWNTIPNEMEAKVMDLISDRDTLWSLLGLESHGTEYSSYVGRSWSNIRDDETGKEFKESVHNALRAINRGKEGPSCSTIEEAWYNG